MKNFREAGDTSDRVKSFALASTEWDLPLPVVETVRWSAPDGLQIQGWLLRPRGTGPSPLVMIVHGGPVWLTRPSWLGRAYGWGGHARLPFRGGSSG